MKKLSLNQREAVFQISGNIAVAWFISGIVGPFYTGVKDFLDFFYKFVVSLIIFLGFSFVSIFIVKKKHDRS